MDIKASVQEFINANLAFRDEFTEIDDNLDIFSVGYVNSLFSITLISFMEKKYNIQIDNSELNIENFNTINNITSFITRKVNET